LYGSSLLSFVQDTNAIVKAKNSGNTLFIRSDSFAIISQTINYGLWFAKVSHFFSKLMSIGRRIINLLLQRRF